MESIISVTKGLKLCIAHRLMHHNGKCKNLHGHNYKVTARFSAKNFSGDNGMVIDFGIIKNVVFKHLEDSYDHTTFLHKDDPLVNILATAGTPVVPMLSHPTAENMCYFFIVQINNLLLSIFDGQVMCTGVSVEETEGSKAVLDIDAEGLMQEIRNARLNEAVKNQAKQAVEEAVDEPVSVEAQDAGAN